MKITLTAYERKAILEEADKYEKETGDKYSIRFVMLLLAERFTESLETNIKEIFQEKRRVLEEERTKNQ